MLTKGMFLSEYTCFFIIRGVESTRTSHSCTLIFFLPMYPMSSSCFDLILDKGGGHHGLHVCVRSVVGSLLSLLTLTHRRQGGCAGRLPCGGRRRAEARGGGKGGGARDEEVAMLRRSSRRQTRVRDGRSSRQRQERRRLSLLLLLLLLLIWGRRCRHSTPARPRGRSAVQSGPTDKKYFVKIIYYKEYCICTTNKFE
jgi:hypothetical protein